MERDHAKEKQKLVKDKDAGEYPQDWLDAYDFIHASNLLAKSQLTKANQTKTKMENLARELQKVRCTERSSSHPLTFSLG